jgi:hypothetical protein
MPEHVFVFRQELAKPTPQLVESLAKDLLIQSPKTFCSPLQVQLVADQLRPGFDYLLQDIQLCQDVKAALCFGLWWSKSLPGRVPGAIRDLLWWSRWRGRRRQPLKK